MGRKNEKPPAQNVAKNSAKARSVSPITSQEVSGNAIHQRADEDQQQ
jgi:hypothetical protein